MKWIRHKAVWEKLLYVIQIKIVWHKPKYSIYNWKNTWHKLDRELLNLIKPVHKEGPAAHTLDGKSLSIFFLKWITRQQYHLSSFLSTPWGRKSQLNMAGEFKNKQNVYIFKNFKSSDCPYWRWHVGLCRKLPVTYNKANIADKRV